MKKPSQVDRIVAALQSGRSRGVLAFVVAKCVVLNVLCFSALAWIVDPLLVRSATTQDGIGVLILYAGAGLLVSIALTREYGRELDAWIEGTRQ
jgi:hypothetical protein